jgi:hypothetical protein
MQKANSLFRNTEGTSANKKPQWNEKKFRERGKEFANAFIEALRESSLENNPKK